MARSRARRDAQNVVKIQAQHGLLLALLLMLNDL